MVNGATDPTHRFIRRIDPKLLVLGLGAIIFLAEFFVMVLFEQTSLWLSQIIPHFIAVLDAILLILIISPALYILYIESRDRLAFEREIERERNKFKNIFDSAGEGVCLIRSDYTIEMANRRLKELVRTDKIIGKKCYEVYPDEKCGTEECTVRKVLTTGSMVTVEKTAKIGSKTIWLGITAAPFRDINGNIIGVVVFVRDITKSKLLEEQLRRSKEELERYSKMLEEKNTLLEEQYKILKKKEWRERQRMELLSYLNSVDVNYIAEKSIRKLIEITNSQIGLVYLFDDEHGKLRCYASYTVDGNAIRHFSSNGLPEVVFNRNEMIRIDGNLDVDLGFGKTRIRSVLGIPLSFQKKRIGAIILASLNGYSDEDVEFLRTCIGEIASAINNAMTYRLIQIQAKQLEEMNKELMRANKLKDEFLANVSHEFRTPLNSIIGFANLLAKNKEGNLTKKQLNYIEKILKNAKHLLNLINDLLDLSKIEAGRIEINIRSVDIVKLVKETAESIKPQAEAKSLYLKIDIPQSPIITETDPDRVRQILLNLLSNAVKFTERGGITVRVELEGRWIKIHVIDTGIGIPEDMLDKIFDKFVQGSYKRGGTGLGLAISKKLAELLGGKITVKSKVGEGSTFTLWLPLRRTEKIVEEDVEDKSKFIAERVNRVRGKTILIVDDDPDAVELLKTYVQEVGCNVLVAKNGEECIKIAKEKKPDLILLDIIMPGIDGWETLKRLKSDPETANIPVVIVSIVAEKRRGIYLGAVDCLTKPVSKEDLLYTLVRCLNNRCGRVLVVDDDEEFLSLMESYLRGRCKELKLARNGVEALEILRNFKPDVIFLDLIMPVMDGFKFLEILRSKDEFRNVPVVIVTAKELTDEERERLKTQTSAILNKTPHLEEDIKRELMRICSTISND